MINAITPISPVVKTGGLQAPEAVESPANFGDIFRSAVDAVKETDAEKTQMQYLMATGQLDNPAALTLAGSKYEMSVNLLVQLRNRALEAYNELMRISL